MEKWKQIKVVIVIISPSSKLKKKGKKNGCGIFFYTKF